MDGACAAHAENGKCIGVRVVAVVVVVVVVAAAVVTVTYIFVLNFSLFNDAETDLHFRRSILL
jgi:flagellar basal body-associated protein FliL